MRALPSRKRLARNANYNRPGSSLEKIEFRLVPGGEKSGFLETEYSRVAIVPGRFERFEGGFISHRGLCERASSE